MRSGHLVAGIFCAAARAFSQEAEKPPEWQLLERIAAARGFAADFDAVATHLEAMVAERDGSLGATRLSRVMEALRQPWRAPAVAAELRDGAAAAMAKEGRADLPLLLESVGGWLDAGATATSAIESAPEFAELDELWHRISPIAPAALDPTAVPTENEELLDLLSAYLGGCHDALAPLLAEATDEQRALVRATFPDWCEAFFRCHSPKPEVTSEQNALLEQWKTIAWKLDRPRLLAASRRVARLADPRFLSTLGRRLAKTVRTKAKVDGFSGDVVATAGARDETRVVLLGGGKTTVSGRAALVIDLGGDDTWERAAVAAGDGPLASVVLELGGNDRYVGLQPGPAFAAGGAALLVDCKGKDSYENGRLAQGAAALGFAALVDLDGSDRYSARDYAQGYSFAGIALLLDRSGDDVYDAWAYAQGGGNGNGFAALVDGGGDDRYVANGHWPDVYGDSGAGSFHGASQGYSFGFRDGRPLAGGFGLLADLGQGSDYYESGNFSQGGAYYFGFGLMYDGGGDDENHGWRYSQGFGVHQAVGIRWDAGGNDRYDTKCAANCGAGWDEGVGWLIDDAGNDQYDVGGLALGGTANSAVAVLLDRAGDDRYGGGGGADSQGGSSDSSYHDFQAIGALLDLGGGKDAYKRAGRGDGVVATGEWFGLFVDAKEKEAKALLALPATSPFWQKTVGGKDGRGETGPAKK